MGSGNVHRYIAWKFMLKGTESGHFSWMTFVAWVAIAVGVAAMGVLLSVMYGFEGALRDRFLNAFPHVLVKAKNANDPVRDYEEWTERWEKLQGIKRVMPFIETEMVLQSAHRTVGGVIWGVRLKDLEALKEGISEGSLPNPEAKFPQVLIGRELGHRLGVYPGSKIRVISPIQKGGMMGAVPEAETFEIAGLYASGHYEFDQQYLYLPLEDAQDLMKWGSAISGWHIWAKDMDNSDVLRRQVQATLPSEWKAEGWETFNSALFQSLKLEQYSMFTILSFAILIAVLNIVITLMMHVSHKRKNIGVLRALGASQGQVQKIFLWQGVWMGTIGLLASAIITAVVLIYLRHFSTFQLPDIYYDRSIPIEIRPLSFVLIYLVAGVMIFLATVYPSRRASQLDPIEAIRE
jgi:lipoprotein-releasing system permease protein